MCIIDCLSTIVFILPLHLDYTKVIILILWWRNFQLEYWRTFQLVSTLHRDGRFEETKYFIRYFQPDGAGTLKMSDGTVLLPNDLYPLPGETFRLYYTSASTDQQTVDVYFQDSFGQLQQLTFSFNNDNNKEEENK